MGWSIGRWCLLAVAASMMIYELTNVARYPRL
jgi:hypothetical protein